MTTSADPVVRESPSWWPSSEPMPERLDVAFLTRAYEFSAKAHEGQFRKNGDPFVSHCVEVAKILADLQLDTVTVASGLIHDVVEDTPITTGDIEKEFGVAGCATTPASASFPLPRARPAGDPRIARTRPGPTRGEHWLRVPTRRRRAAR